jgi:inner membrane transporter RhtA
VTKGLGDTRENGNDARALPLSALFAAMVSLQYGATLAKGLFETVGAEGTTALRLCAAALILALFMRPWRTRLSLAVMPALVGYGLMLAAMNLLFYMSLRTIPLGVASALQFIGPLLVATLSSRRPVDFLWIALAVIGIALVSPPIAVADRLDPLGVTLALAAGACWALYIVLGQKTGAQLGVQSTAFGMAIAALFVLPIGLLHAGTAMFDPQILILGLIIGIFSGALPFTLEMLALTRLPARVYGTSTSIEPVIGAVLGYLLLNEALTPFQWCGVAVIVAAILGTSLTSRVR